MFIHSVIIVCLFYRVILTRDNIETHQHAISVVKRVLRAAQETIDNNKSNEKGKTWSLFFFYEIPL